MRRRWLVPLALLALALPAFGAGLECAENCSEAEAGECAPMCTLCGSCALPVLPSIPVAISGGLEPALENASPASPRTLAGMTPGIFHVPRLSTS